jgi:hypothetical protein
MNRHVSGEWNSVCYVCGFKFKASQLHKNWKGFYVCEKDLESRHPQDFIKVLPEAKALPFTRPDAATGQEQVCYLEGSSGYAGIAIAGCMTAGNNTHTPAFLLSLLNG